MTARDAPAKHHDETGSPLTALIVDDSAVDRRLMTELLEKEHGLRIRLAANGAEALAEVERDPPGLILTDLQMQPMDGLELVAKLRDRYPLIPVIIITAYGSEEIAVQALRRGAASYVPKRNLARSLVSTVEQVLAAARVDRRRQRLLECLKQTEFAYELESDVAYVPLLVTHFQEYLLRLGLCDHTAKVRAGIALEEALLNALYHGNLEVSSALRQMDDSPFYRLAAERCRLSPYRERRLHVHARMSRAEAVFVIRDEGPGFDPGSLPDPTDPENVAGMSGRGMLLIRTFMDEVRYNASGNEITLIKRRTSEESCES